MSLDGQRENISFAQDGHVSHRCLEILREALARNIRIVTLPPRATDVLQPLDVGIFGPLRARYRQYLNEDCVDMALDIAKATFAEYVWSCCQCQVDDNIANVCTRRANRALPGCSGESFHHPEHHKGVRESWDLSPESQHRQRQQVFFVHAITTADRGSVNHPGDQEAP